MRTKRHNDQKLPTSYYHGWQEALANQDFFEIEAIKNLVDRYEDPLLSGRSFPKSPNVSYIKINIPDKKIG